MYMRRIARKNKDGSTTAYIQLAHNYRDPETGVPRAKVLHSFGREDQLDTDAIRRLIKSMSRFLSPEEAVATAAELDGRRGPLEIRSSRILRSPWLLDQLWRELGIRGVLEDPLEDRKHQSPVGRGCCGSPSRDRHHRLCRAGNAPFSRYPTLSSQR